MLPPYFFWILLFVVCAFTAVRGRADERIAAGAALFATLSTRFVLSPLDQRYDGVELGLLLLDVAMLATFVAIALRSSRFWPLWVAGLQLTITLSHLLKAINVDLLPRAYGAAAVFWSYPILIIILLGTLRTPLYYRPGAPSPA